MKINVKAHELVDGEIEFISLVEHGANRSPFKIIKTEDATANMWAGLCPELEKLEKRFADSESATTETNKMILKNAATAFAKADAQPDQDKIRELGLAKARHKLNGLNEQQMLLWEQPTHPLFQKLDADYSLAIQKCELELAALGGSDISRHETGGFFHRGGVSIRSQADAYDSAFDRPSFCKNDSVIDLSPIATQADFDRINKIDEDDDFDLETLVL